MKLLNEEGRFQFIKNQQVKIDETLLKYQLVNIKKKKNDGELVVPSMDTRVSSEDIKSVDKTLRDVMLEMGKNNLREYLSKEDAKEFNEKFKPILEGEVDENGYSLLVTNGRWRNEIEPWGYMDDESPQKNNRGGLLAKINGLLNSAKDKINKSKEEREAQKEAFKVIDFFDIIHVMSGKEKEFIDRVDGYFSLIRNAAIMHQDAQLDELCQGIIINIYESVLAINGYNKYVTFGEIEKLKKDGARMVDIDYISNFGRTIPNDIVDKKIKCDDFCVFDNYCVMYYDPSGETYKVTSKAKRDPILFGLINHSDKLYYIGDWVDDKCDLTLDKIAESATVNEIK